MKNKKQIVYVLTVIIVLFVVIFSAAYSYFLTAFKGSELKLSATTDNHSYVFKTTNPQNITLEFNNQEMQERASSIEAIAQDDGSLEVELYGLDNETLILCTYDLMWYWDSDDKFETSTVSLPYTANETVYNFEYSIQGSGQVQDPSTNYEYPNLSIDEIDLSALAWNDNHEAVLKTNIPIASKSLENATKQKWTVVNKFYNLPIDQKHLSGSIYQAHIGASNVSCSVQ